MVGQVFAVCGKKERALSQESPEGDDVCRVGSPVAMGITTRSTHPTTAGGSSPRV